MINVNVNDKQIPPGKILIAEYSDKRDGPDAQVIVVEKGTSRLGRPTELQAVIGGWAIAGSCLRWDNGHWRVATMVDGTRHSRGFKTETEARAAFVSATTPAEVQP